MGSCSVRLASTASRCVFVCDCSVSRSDLNNDSTCFNVCVLQSMVQVETLGELGVFFTLFVVGLEFSPERLRKVNDQNKNDRSI